MENKVRSLIIREDKTKERRQSEMLHISICDDEKLTADRIKELVEEALKEKALPAVIDIYPEGEAFLNKYFIRDDELIIIDMDMKEYPVFEMIGKFEEMNRSNLLILVTDQDHLALEAMPYGPFQVIRKKGYGQRHSQSSFTVRKIEEAPEWNY